MAKIRLILFSASPDGFNLIRHLQANDRDQSGLK